MQFYYVLATWKIKEKQRNTSQMKIGLENKIKPIFGRTLS